MDSLETQWYIDCMNKCIEGFEPNFVNVICKTNGWNDLVVDEKIYITYGDKKYVIERTK
jgi:hypothetical protein